MTMTIRCYQREIHRMEDSKDFDGAAQALVEHRYYQVSRSQRFLACLPYPNGLDAIAAIYNRTPEVRRPWPGRRKPLFSDERQAGAHYLTHYAPAEDRIHVHHMTMDVYKRLGGGPIQEYSMILGVRHSVRWVRAPYVAGKPPGGSVPTANPATRSLSDSRAS